MHNQNILAHRSVQTSIQISLGGIGAIVGTVSYRAKDAPRFIPGVQTSSFLFLFLALTAFRTHYHPCVPRSPPFGPPCHDHPFLPEKQTHEIGIKVKTSRRSARILLYALMNNVED